MSTNSNKPEVNGNKEEEEAEANPHYGNYIVLACVFLNVLEPLPLVGSRLTKIPPTILTQSTHDGDENVAPVGLVHHQVVVHPRTAEDRPGRVGAH